MAIVTSFSPYIPRNWLSGPPVNKPVEIITRLPVDQQAALLQELSASLTNHTGSLGRWSDFVTGRGAAPQALVARLSPHEGLVTDLLVRAGLVVATASGVFIGGPRAEDLQVSLPTPDVLDEGSNQFDWDVYEGSDVRSRISSGMALAYAQNKETWDSHFQNCQMSIREASRSLTDRDRVSILGAGSCRDVPVMELARDFASTDLFDIDLASLQEGRQAVPVSLRHKVNVTGVDLTGLVFTYLKGVDSILKAAKTPEAATREITHFTEKLEVPSQVLPNKPVKSSLVISMMILTQLGSGIGEGASFLFGKRFPSVENIIQNIPWRVALSGVISALQKRHVELLASMGDNVLLITEKSEQFFNLRGETSAPQPMVLRSFSDAIAANFNIRNAKEWRWVRRMPRGLNELGAVMNVHSVFMRRK